jgi:8-oxo-dGTP pyrophosphatase MutT (NUDIX family)
MPLALQARRVAMRCAYAGLRTYWFLRRPQIVGVKCVVTHGDDVLLVRHTYGHRDWDLPGGWVKRRELPLEAARREMHEELGRDIDDWDALGELFVSVDHHRDNLHLFRAHLPDRRLDIDLTELAEAVWFPLDALPRDVGRYVPPIMARVRKS